MRLKIRYVYKKILMAFVSCLITFTMVINSIFFAFADTPSVAQMDPALIPIFTTVASVAVALGIQAQNGTEALNQLINDAISQIKYNEVLKATSDNTYNSPYRVVGSNGEPEKPNNNNKNGKWFALAGASALTGAVLGEKGMVEDIATTLNDLNAFKPMQGSIALVTPEKFYTQSSASNVALQLANISNSSVTQFDQLIHSDWFNGKNYDDYLYTVKVYVPDIIQAEPKYPRMLVQAWEKTEQLKYLDLTNAFANYTYSNNYGSLSYVYAIGPSGDNQPRFLNNDKVSLNVKFHTFFISTRNANDTFSYRNVENGQTNRLYVGTVWTGMNTPQQNAYSGYKWQYQTPWGFTQNVYNSNDTIINQYPNWDNEQIELLGQQIDALRIGIQNLNNPWAPTQPEIQTSPAPDAVISQLLNNWLNPENAPDPDPDTEPDPDPSPYPDPVPEPVPDDSYLGEFMLPSTITEKFPFSIPFDIARCLRLFNTNSREAPRWECDLTYGNNTSHIVLDLSVFDNVAALIRPIEFIAFLVGLAYATRYLIKG